MTTLTHSDGSPRAINSKLDQLEASIGSLDIGTGEHALNVLLELDDLQARLQKAEASGTHLQAELVQWDYICQLVRKNARLILNKMGGPAGLMKKRIELQADESAWWWYLDDLLAERRKKNIRKTLTGVVGAVLLIALLVFGYKRFLAPPPEVTESYFHRLAAESAMQAGDVQTALNEIDLALGYLPEEPELLTVKSVLLQYSGQPDQAQIILDQARSLAQDDLSIYLAQAQTYLLLGDTKGIREMGGKIVEEYPDSAYGPMFLGTADELEENYESALTYLQQSVSLAEEQGDMNLSANLRVRIATLVQKSMAPSLPLPTETP